MRTLGVDPASYGGSSGVCEVDWNRRTSSVVSAGYIKNLDTIRREGWIHLP